jgi:hypothetical protein
MNKESPKEVERASHRSQRAPEDRGVRCAPDAARQLQPGIGHVGGIEAEEVGEEV